MTLLGAVCIHAVAFSLVWQFLNQNELKSNSSTASSTTIVLSQTRSAPSNQQANEPTAKNTINDNLVPTKVASDFEPYEPTNVAQFEPDVTALIEPSPEPGLKTQTKTSTAKEVLQPTLKTTPVFETLAKAESAKKVTTEKVSQSSVLPPLEGEHVTPTQSPEKQIANMPKIKTAALIHPANTSSEPKEAKVNHAFVSANESDPPPNQHTVNAAPNTAATDASLAMKNYYTELGSWLAKHKKYPRRARQRKQEGSALLYFIVDRNGQILEHSVAESSGYKLLDKEVSAMLKRAEPLPKMPNLMHQAKLEITVPIEFSLR